MKYYSFTLFNPAYFLANPTVGEPRWCYDTEVKQTIITANDLKELLVDNHITTTQKELTHMFNGCNWVSKDDPHAKLKKTRNDRYFVSKTAANVKSTSLIILDYDNGVTIDEVREKLQHLKHIGYTSYNHTAELHKFRVVLFLNEPIPSNLLLKPKVAERSILPALFDQFGGIDLTSFDLSRSFFLPSCPAERRMIAESWYNEGEEYDWTSLPITITERQVYLPSENKTDLVSLFKANGLYNHSLGNGKHEVLCPWRDHHTSTSPGGTVVWDTGGWYCQHSHCQHRTYKELMQFFGVGHQPSKHETDITMEIELLKRKITNA